MIELTFRPLDGIWTDPITENRRSRYTFKVPWSQTLTLLDRELFYLNARNLVLEADFRPQDITLGGMPKANARQPDFPGVRLSFDSEHGPLMYPCDSCVFWQHNVRSIALGLEALRALDRFGISGRKQQYTGYLAIEAARPMGAPSPPPKFANAEAAMRFLQSEEVTGIRGAEGLTPRMTWHLAVTRHHPDKVGESDLWGDILDAKKIVEKAGLL